MWGAGAQAQALPTEMLGGGEGETDMKRPERSDHGTEAGK